jgi:tetratricopeptide (TPR) repeat protein
VREEQGKVIPRRQHARAGLFGIGGEDRPSAAGGAPSWIWAVVGGGALIVTLITAIGITARRPSVTIEGGTAAQVTSADSLARILRKHPDDVRANVELGNIYYDTKNFGEALAYYDRARARDTSLVDVAVDRAVALHQAGHPDQAIAQLESLIVRHPDHAVALFDLGVIYEFQGRTADAARVYREAVARATTPQLKHVAAMRLRALENPGAPAAPPLPGNP